MEFNVAKYFNSKIILVIIFFLIVTIAIIIVIPEIYVNCWVVKYYTSDLTGIKKISELNQSRELVVKVLTGLYAIIGGIVGLFLNWKRTDAIQKQIGLTEDNLEILRKKNDQDKIKDANSLMLQQFSKASELLKDNDMSARLSGIFLFEKIMNENIDYYWPIIEILSNYIKEKRSNSNYEIAKDDLKKYDKNEIYYAKHYPNLYNRFDIKKIKEDRTKIITKFYKKVPVERDVQAAINALGSRELTFSVNPITLNNLKYLNIKAAELSEYDLVKSREIKNELNKIKMIDLKDVNFYGAFFNNKDFSNFLFKRSHFIDCGLNNSTMNNSQFYGCSFKFSRCSNSNLIFSQLYNTEFYNSECFESNFNYSNMKRSLIINTNISYSNFFQSELQDSSLLKVDCSGTNFFGTNLTNSKFVVAELYDSFFKEAICHNTQFNKSKSIRTLFIKTILQEANFQNLELISCKFDESICYAANFKNTIINNITQLAGIQIWGLKGLSTDDVDKLVELTGKDKNEIVFKEGE